MGSVIAFDPSTRSTGWSIWFNGTLSCAGAIRAKNLEGMLTAMRAQVFGGHLFDVCVIERPEIYLPSKAKANPNKVQQLSIVAGACALKVAWEKLLMPYPKDWKGSVPKHVTEMHMEKKVGRQWPKIQEILSQQLKTSRDDVADAIALGVWAHQRMYLALSS